ncbi:peroxiredoxin [Pseudooceanicola sp. CBS1P-1]|uniref:Glutathione-dependent peroxiredoxin n=1 Tax=Pseudooceanicola albus TaxID=2692189 RepID=A0A6L7G8C8_9RHOB|nr:MULTISPECIES: peroxiredoxin [Pseudooceanicola]MBT9384122.1 peroxiredoxin [Pseudooceanicola endophyticus]MXN19778.1 redoxin family protein [Pseudooceanicola albus]
MTLSTGDTLPDATLVTLTAEGPKPVSMKDKTAGRKVVIFGLPGAFTGTCSTAHVPSFMRTIDAFKAKGVDEVICVSVNDPFVMDAWSKDTGAGAAGLTFLADASSDFTKAIGMNFSAPAIGFADRSKRYALYAEDGVVKVFNLEENPGVCEMSAGETLLEAI